MPDATTKSLSFGLLLRDTARLFFMHWRRHLILSFLCAVPLALLLALHYFDPLIDFFKASLNQPELQRMPDGTPSMTISAPGNAALVGMRFISLGAVTLMLVSAYATSWWAGLFELKQLPEGGARHYFEGFIAILSRLVLVAVIMLVVSYGIDLIDTALTMLLMPVLRPLGAGQFFRFLVLAALQIVQLGIGIRLVIAVPPILWEEHIPFKRAWDASAGTTLSLGATALVLAMVPVVLMLVAGVVLGGGTAHAGMLFQAATLIILGPVIFLYHALQITLVAVTFQKLREAGKL